MATHTAEALTETTSPLAGQYLSFTLGDEEYGIDILKVQEIRGWDDQTRHIPDSPPYVKGVLELRGHIVPIVDLRIRFATGEARYLPTTVVIVVATERVEGGQTLGLVVDGVSDVIDVNPEDLRPPPRIGGRIKADFIQGMVSLERRMVVLLDAERLLQAGDLEAVA